jgi:hypothetical protein
LPTGGGPNANLVASASLRVEVLRPGVPLSALSARARALAPPMALSWTLS